MVDLIGLDADDTLWHNMPLFSGAGERFAEIVSPYLENEADVSDRLYQTETRNLEIFGYGIKGFTLSMIETAIDVSEARISAEDIRSIIEIAREMLAAPVELLEGVTDVIPGLAAKGELALITKGDLFDQEAKLARSGIGDYFSHVEVVSNKTPDAYERILRRIGVDPGRFLMVGDSLKSDVLPVLEIGGHACHIPCEGEWVHEKVDPARVERYAYREVRSIRELPALLSDLR